MLFFWIPNVSSYPLPEKRQTKCFGAPSSGSFSLSAVLLGRSNAQTLMLIKGEDKLLTD